jgi:2-isopropylmalate synthase
MWQIFADEYLGAAGSGPVELVKLNSASDEGTERITATVRVHGADHVVDGVGNGPVSAFCDALSGVDLGYGGLSVRVLDYNEHALTAGRDAEAAAYLEIEIGDEVLWGVGVSESTTQASLRAVLSAVNRAARRRES